MKVSEVLRGKGDEVVTIAPETTVRELVQTLRQHNIGAIVVSTSENPVAGIVSERDVVRAIANGVEVLDSPVSAIMTSKVRTATLDDTVHDLMRLMTEHRFRHVPVVVDDRLHGIVSIGDVVKSRIGELEFERDQLESYVSR